MDLRKTAGLLAAAGLSAGLIGGGVGAAFQDQVTAQQNINVGTFECLIVEPSDGTVSGDGKSVTYDAPTVLSGGAGSSPFSFKVKATGAIPVLATISHSALSGTFYSLNDPVAPAGIDAGSTKTYHVGLAWSDLAGFEGATLSITYTVDCNEVTSLTTFGSSTVTESGGTYTIVSNGPDPVYDPAPEYGGVRLTSRTSGMLIGAVDYSFVSSGDVAGGAPRFSLPISTDGSSTIAYYAFIDVLGCNAAAVDGGIYTVSTALANCSVFADVDGTFANWDAFAAAHPTYTIAAGHLPFIIADGSLGTYVVSAITEAP